MRLRPVFPDPVTYNNNDDVIIITSDNQSEHYFNNNIRDAMGYLASYLLIAVCVVMALIHQILQPYSHYFLNVFDGLILHFLILVSSLPLVEISNSFDFNSIVGTAFALVILPSLIFIVMSLMINKEKIKELMKYCYFKCKQFHLSLRNYNEIPLNEEVASHTDDEFYNVVDDSSRVNTTVCEV